MPFFDFDDNDPKLTPDELPDSSGKGSSAEEGGLFANIDSTPLDDLVDESGMVVKKSGAPNKKRAGKVKPPAPDSTGFNDAESEELLRAIVGPDVIMPPSAPLNQSPAQQQPSPASPQENESIGAEDAPTGETPTPSGTGILGFVKKMTSTLGLGRTVKEDSPSLGETPSLPADQKPPSTPVKRRNEKDDFDSDESGGAKGRLGDLKVDDQSPTTSSLGKRPKDSISRKRKTSALELPSMDLDNPQPVEESDWLKTVTGVLLGHDESPVQPSAEEKESVTSRLDTLGIEDVEGPRAFTKTPQQSPPVEGAPEASPESSAWSSSIDALPPPPEQPQSPAPQQDAEFQAFLGKLQQEGQEEAPKEHQSKLDDDDLLASLLSEAPQGSEEQDSGSLSRLSSLDSESGDEGPADPAYWRISTRPLGKDSQASEPTMQMSPFSTDIEFWDGHVDKPAAEKSGSPIPQPESSMVGSVDTSSWELPPEVQELLDKQKTGSTIQSPFDGSTVDVHVDQPAKPAPTGAFTSSFLGIDESTPGEELPADHPLLSQGMIEMPDFFAPSNEESPAAGAYKPTSPLIGFGGLDFNSPSDQAPAADAYRDTSPLGHQQEGYTRPFDLLSGSEEAPASDAYRETSSLQHRPSGNTMPFDFLSGSEEAPASDAYRDTSSLQHRSSGNTMPFDFLPGSEEAPASEAYKETKPLMGSIEPPDASFFFSDQPSTFGESVSAAVSPFDEKPQTTPLSRRIESPSFNESSADSDLRSMFTQAPAIAESAPSTAVVSAAPSPQLVESAPRLEKPPMSTRTKLLLAFGGLAAALTFVVIVAAGILLFRSNLIPAAPFAGPPQAQPVSATVQVAPMGLELTGGWTFYLQKGDLKDGSWTPQGGSEWLNGTELRRIVALPWNPQLEAVSKTFKTGDPVRMLMNNNDIISYRIDKVETVTRDQVDVLEGNTPALVVILYRNDSNERVVILAH